MDSNLLIACIIAGSFFVAMIGFFVSGFVSEYKQMERARRVGVSAWVFCEEGGEMRNNCGN